VLTSVADTIQDLGSGSGFSCFPMERYIGLIKSTISQRRDIDSNIAHRMLIIEHLNHLPRPEFLRQPMQLDLSSSADYPFTSRQLRSYGGLTPHVMKLLRNHFKQCQSANEVSKMEVTIWAKYHLRWRLAIGSVASQGRWGLLRRDDSYICWNYRNRLYFGQVQFYCKVDDWEHVAVVRPFEGVVRDEFGRVKVTGILGAMETTPCTEIQGIIGRIRKPATGTLPGRTFLVTEGIPGGI
jgi:hypothetical protein